MGPAFNCTMPQMDHHPRGNVGNFSTNNERLHLKWKGLAANLSAEVSDLSFTKSDTDVLLLPSASKGFSLKAHRVVLAAASDFFKSVLLQSPCGEDPVLLLESMDGETLNDLMDYLYRGQVNLTPRRLDRLIAWGKVLAIKGILELEATATSSTPQYVRPTFHPASQMDLPMNCAAPSSWSMNNAPPISNGNWSNHHTSHSTGLSLLASAALDSDHDVVVRERRFSSGNDENNSLNGNNGPSIQTTPPVSAMNLSMKSNSNCDSSDPTSTASGKQSTMPNVAATGLKPVLYPKQNSILNIPNPNSLKWKRALMTSVAAAAAASTSSTMTSGAELMDVVDGSEDEDALTIDMSANIPIQETSTTPVGLPATPSPSPSSIGNGNTSIVDNRLPVIEKGNGLSFQMGILPPSAPMNSSSNEELLNHSHVKPRQNSESLSQSSNGEGKKWKSRQPKLCEHCDRYFSNQFNLKQHILNMHTVGGDVRCDKCNKTVKNKWYLRRHHVTHHNAPLKK